MLNKIARLLTDNARFLKFLGIIETLVSKILSVGMVLVSFVAVLHLAYILMDTLTHVFSVPSEEDFNRSLFRLFGLFLNVLIALEILENVTSYLKKHIIQVELVLVTSLIAISRKIIIFDLEKKDSTDLISLSVAVFSLSLSYVLIRFVNRHEK